MLVDDGQLRVLDGHGGGTAGGRVDECHLAEGLVGTHRDGQPVSGSRSSTPPSITPNISSPVDPALEDHSPSRSTSLCRWLP